MRLSLPPFLTTSIIIHVVVLGGASLVSLPEFAVEEAPSSLEVVMIEQSKKEEKDSEKSEEIVTSLLEATPTDEVVLQKKQEKKKEAPPKKDEPKKQQGEEEIKETVVMLSKGALSENKPHYLKNPAPIYPQIAKTNGWEGLVILRVRVEKDGRPAQVILEKSSSYKILDQSALKTVQKWQFQPARVGNVPISSWIRIPVRFLLSEEEK